MATRVMKAKTKSRYRNKFYCESEIKYSENVYSKIMSQGQKMAQNSSDCSICNLDFKNFRGRTPIPPSGAAERTECLFDVVLIFLIRK